MKPSSETESLHVVGSSFDSGGFSIFSWIKVHLKIKPPKPLDKGALLNEMILISC